MKLIKIYARQNGSIAHVDDGTFPFIPELNTSVIVTFDGEIYPEQYQQIAQDTTRVHWNGSALLLDNVEYLSAAFIAARLAETTKNNAISAAKSGLKDKVILAQNHAETIRQLFNAVWDNSLTLATQPTRFQALQTIVANASQAFRNVIVTDIQQELGFDVTSAGLTLAQQRQATAFMRSWTVGAALLLTQA